LSKGKKLIEVYRSTSEMEALVIKSLLESYGISCLLKSNAAPSVHVFAMDGMGEVRVMIWDSEAEKARDLIKGKDNV